MVHFVGAGSGAADLITLRGKNLLEKADVIKAYVVGDDLKEIDLRLGDLTDAERQIILDGCLINYYKSTM